MIIYIVIAIVGLQLIYFRYTDLPFYYKEIIYDWNYTTKSNTKLQNTAEWLNLKWNSVLQYNINIEKNIDITAQTNLFSFQKEMEIHSHLNAMILISGMIVYLYLFYIITNAFTYNHEKAKIKKLIGLLLLIFVVLISIYNTEIMTTLLYKINFIYTDNIYLTNQQRSNTWSSMLVTSILLIYYVISKKEERLFQWSKYYIYILHIVINILDENTIIGIEYLYIIIYVEILLLIINTLKNKRTDG